MYIKIGDIHVPTAFKCVYELKQQSIKSDKLGDFYIIICDDQLRYAFLKFNSSIAMTSAFQNMFSRMRKIL